MVIEDYSYSNSADTPEGGTIVSKSLVCVRACERARVCNTIVISNKIVSQAEAFMLRSVNWKDNIKP